MKHQKASITINHGQGKLETITRPVYQRSTSGIFVGLDEKAEASTIFGIAGCEWFPYNSEKVSVRIV